MTPRCVSVRNDRLTLAPMPKGHFTYVTALALLSFWRLQSIRDLPDMYKLEEVGLVSKVPMPDELRGALGLSDVEETAEAFALTDE
jgi:hypothetical protein